MRTRPKKRDSDSFFLRLLFGSSAEVTNDDVAYFRRYPDQIDEITAPIAIHRVFLWACAALGSVLVAVSKVLKYSALSSFLSDGVKEFTVDIVYESGVALIGAALTAYILGIVLNKQQENAAAWRTELRRRIGLPVPPEDR
ncbi:MULTISPECIES: hypothetical protein [unclassified Variovorax]|jgi:hypothetical protein|uniref:hypothetical protein n=1 Tax=unclassified Variovorax TaxID=663243 RepID=UPI000F7EC0C0|nr:MULTISPECIES: hypothetical protein [unclassified Variovorax]RSZ39713.1 hypothetical protein EJO70_17150 [Variovorax sp. 553]RSZ40581.1 hypothetical protein EJO71_17070 [Variovorax sp. 679]